MFFCYVETNKIDSLVVYALVLQICPIKDAVRSIGSACPKR